VVLTTAGAVLRFAGIGDKSLWIDEAFSDWVSQQPIDDLLRITANLDLHPPLYYASLHGWLSFGDGEVALRSLSALLSVLTLPVVFLIGERVGGRALGLLSSGLLALSPLHIAYAQQARMYAMMTFFAALSILLMLDLLIQTDGNRSGFMGERRRSCARWPILCWGFFVLSTVLMMFSHNTGVLEPVAIALFIVIVAIRSSHDTRRRRADRIAGAGALRHPLRGVVGVAAGLFAALALWSPWLPHFLAQSRRVDDEFWIAPPTLSTFIEHWGELANAFGPTGVYRDIVLLAVLVLVVFGVRELRGRPAASSASLLLLLLLLVPVAVELLVSLRRPIFFTQTLVWTSVPLSVLLGAGLLRLRFRPLVALAAGAIIVLSTIAIHGYYRYEGKEDWRAAAQYVAQRASPQQLLLFSAAWTQLPFDYYYNRQGGPPLVQHGFPTDMRESQVLEQKVTPADITRLDELTMRRSTVWLIYSHDWYTDPRGLVPSRLSALLQAVESRAFPGITVVRYRARA
jgi:mannosyltransferase